MKSAMKDIFYGNKGQMESMKLPREHFETDGEKVCYAYDQLKDRLSPELLELHHNFVNALENNFCEEIDFYFIEGFQPGVLIRIECAGD